MPAVNAFNDLPEDCGDVEANDVLDVLLERLETVLRAMKTDCEGQPLFAVEASLRKHLQAYLPNVRFGVRDQSLGLRDIQLKALKVRQSSRIPRLGPMSITTVGETGLNAVFSVTVGDKWRWFCAAPCRPSDVQTASRAGRARVTSFIS
jgi:hypothetical protein